MCPRHSPKSPPQPSIAVCHSLSHNPAPPVIPDPPELSEPDQPESDWMMTPRLDRPSPSRPRPSTVPCLPDPSNKPPTCQKTRKHACRQTPEYARHSHAQVRPSRCTRPPAAQRLSYAPTKPCRPRGQDKPCDASATACRRRPDDLHHNRNNRSQRPDHRPQSDRKPRPPAVPLSTSGSSPRQIPPAKAPNPC